MGLKSLVFKPLAIKIARDINRWSAHAVRIQHKIFEYLVKIGKDTTYGKDHDFEDITSYQDFRNKVPTQRHIDLLPYMERIQAGEKNVLWRGLPKYFVQSVGSAGATRLVPLTRESLPYHTTGARNTALNYFARSGRGSFFDGKLLFINRSFRFESNGAVPHGSMARLISREIPSWQQSSHLPSAEVNELPDWQGKLQSIVEESVAQDIRMISGDPLLVLEYYQALLQHSGAQQVIDVFPNLSLYMHNHRTFISHREKMETLIGQPISTLETYTTAEGFLAFEDRQEEGLLLNTNAGIFYEFIPVDQLVKPHPPRLSLEDVSIDEEYTVILNTNSGLWGYHLEDCIQFTSIDPFRIKFVGKME